MNNDLIDLDDLEPSAADLDEIEAEWPVIEAEMGVLDAEIAALSHPGGPSPMDWRRVRRAERQLLAVCVRHALGAVAVEIPTEVA